MDSFVSWQHVIINELQTFRKLMNKKLGAWRWSWQKISWSVSWSNPYNFLTVVVPTPQAINITAFYKDLTRFCTPVQDDYANSEIVYWELSYSLTARCSSPNFRERGQYYIWYRGPFLSRPFAFHKTVEEEEEHVPYKHHLLIKIKSSPLQAISRGPLAGCL